MEKLNILFFCTSGYRARVASVPFENDKRCECRFAGVYSEKKELKDNLEWAEKIVCITGEHLGFIIDNFSEYKDKIINLGLPDYASEVAIMNVSKVKISKILEK